MTIKKPKILLLLITILIASSFSFIFPAKAQTQDITITSPAANSIWTQGSTQTINWNFSGNNNTYPPGNVFISLNPLSCNNSVASSTCTSTNDITPYIITENAPDTGTYIWQMPTFLSPQFYQNPVTLTVGLTNSSSQNTTNSFTILPPRAPTNAVVVSSPAGGEQWPNGGAQTITWINASSKASSTYVSIQLVPTNNSGTNYTVASNIPNTGNYTFNVGSGAVLPAGQYNVNILDYGNNILGTSAGPITILPNTSGINSSSTPIIIGISPSTGSVGSTVNIIGSGLTDSGNTINFGTGTYINNVAKVNGADALQFTTPSQTQPCPPNSAMACPLYVALITPGVYGISVTNSGGTSNTLPFTVISTNTPTTILPANSGNTSTTLTEGSVVKTSNNPTVYLVRNSQLVPFTNAQVFMAFGYTWPQVEIIPDGELSQNNLSTSYVQAPDGTVVKNSNSPTLYYVSYGQKNFIPSISLAAQEDINLNNIITLSQQELDALPNGPSI